MEEIYYFEKYSLVVSWNTFRLMLILITNQVWANRQVDLFNEFGQATLLEDFYLALSYYFDSETGEERSNMVMKLNESLYGLVQEPLYW